MIEVIWDYWLDYEKPIYFSINNLPITLFHNKIPRCCFRSKQEFFKIIDIFKNDLKNISDWCFWINKFRFERIYIKPHINAIRCVYKEICKKQGKSSAILQNLDENENSVCDCFFLECRCYDWSKTCRFFCLFIFSRESKHKIYPLFVDPNHVCCWGWNKVKKSQNFLEDDCNFY